MDLRQIESKVFTCILSIKNTDEESIRKCSNLTELGFDSIELMGLVIDLESIFGIELCHEDLMFENLSNFHMLCDLMRRYLEKCTL
jgi:acyl carrier protein